MSPNERDALVQRQIFELIRGLSFYSMSYMENIMLALDCTPDELQEYMVGKRIFSAPQMMDLSYCARIPIEALFPKRLRGYDYHFWNFWNRLASEEFSSVIALLDYSRLTPHARAHANHQIHSLFEQERCDRRTNESFMHEASEDLATSEKKSSKKEQDE